MNTQDFPLAVNEKPGNNPGSVNTASLLAGAAAVDITPKTPQFLWGYPHVARMSTGVHDPLFASALYLADGKSEVLFVGCDVLVLSKSFISRARKRIAAATGVPSSQIVISTTHTHSGPKTADPLWSEGDHAVPSADENYLKELEEGILEAAREASGSRVPAVAALAVADASGVGGNRHDPAGPSDSRAPVLLVCNALTHRPIGLMLTVCMHPTVMHEDSTLLSGDFPGCTRQYLQQAFLGKGCPVIYNMGPAGNQSPRHVTRANTFAEAERLGKILGRSVQAALAGAEFTTNLPITCLCSEIDLPSRSLISCQQAATELEAARARFLFLQESGAPRTEVRTAECDWFGAETTLALASATEDGRAREALASILPAEIQVFAIGPWRFVTWPGEIFVEFGLALAKRDPATFTISLANGHLQGYIVTQEAVEHDFYEAGNSLLASPEAGDCLVRATVALLDQLPPR